MLTKQHRFARQMIGQDSYPIYKAHMCGLCHALGDDYGLLTRLVTNHEMILLNMLVTAQQPEIEPQISRRCPLNPLIQVTANQGIASRFAAAAAIELARISFQDDVDDAPRYSFLSRCIIRVMDRPHQKAVQTLEEMAFPVETLTGLNAYQHQAERDDADPAQPVAEVSANLFAWTAHLTHQPHNEPTLAQLGAQYGAYLYLADAYRDFPHDIEYGHYNPLRRFATQTNGSIQLAPEGLAWLLTRMKHIHAGMHQGAAQLQVYRHRDALVRLLVKPIDQMTSHLSDRIATGEGITFRIWRPADVLKAAAFAAPVAMTAGAVIVSGNDYCNNLNPDWANQFVAADCSDTVENGCYTIGIVVAGLSFCGCIGKTYTVEEGPCGETRVVEQEGCC